MKVSVVVVEIQLSAFMRSTASLIRRVMAVLLGMWWAWSLTDSVAAQQPAGRQAHAHAHEQTRQWLQQVLESQWRQLEQNGLIDSPFGSAVAKMRSDVQRLSTEEMAEINRLAQILARAPAEARGESLQKLRGETRRVLQTLLDQRMQVVMRLREAELTSLAQRARDAQRTVEQIVVSTESLPADQQNLQLVRAMETQRDVQTLVGQLAATVKQAETWEGESAIVAARMSVFLSELDAERRSEKIVHEIGQADLPAALASAEEFRRALDQVLAMAQNGQQSLREPMASSQQVDASGESVRAEQEAARSPVELGRLGRQLQVARQQLEPVADLTAEIQRQISKTDPDVQPAAAHSEQVAARLREVAVPLERDQPAAASVLIAAAEHAAESARQLRSSSAGGPQPERAARVLQQLERQLQMARAELASQTFELRRRQLVVLSGSSSRLSEVMERTAAQQRRLARVHDPAAADWQAMHDQHELASSTARLVDEIARRELGGQLPTLAEAIGELNQLDVSWSSPERLASDVGLLAAWRQKTLSAVAQLEAAATELRSEVGRAAKELDQLEQRRSQLAQQWRESWSKVAEDLWSGGSPATAGSPGSNQPPLTNDVEERLSQLAASLATWLPAVAAAAPLETTASSEPDNWLAWGLDADRQLESLIARSQSDREQLAQLLQHVERQEEARHDLSRLVTAVQKSGGPQPDIQQEEELLELADKFGTQLLGVGKTLAHWLGREPLASAEIRRCLQQASRLRPCERADDLQSDSPAALIEAYALGDSVISVSADVTGRSIAGLPLPSRSPDPISSGGPAGNEGPSDTSEGAGSGGNSGAAGGSGNGSDSLSGDSGEAGREGSGRGSSSALEGERTTRGGAEEQEPESGQSEAGASEAAQQPSDGSRRGPGGAALRGRVVHGGAAEAWVAELPPGVRESVRAAGSGAPPARYQEALRKYFSRVRPDRSGVGRRTGRSAGGPP